MTLWEIKVELIKLLCNRQSLSFTAGFNCGSSKGPYQKTDYDDKANEIYDRFRSLLLQLEDH